MIRFSKGLQVVAVAAGSLLGAGAQAQVSDDPDAETYADEGRTMLGAGTPKDELPPPRSDDDPRPRAARPADYEWPGVTKQAGVGGTQAYGRAGVLELGGSGGFGAAADYTRFELSPSIGFFVLDNVELSLLTAFNYFDLDARNGNRGASATEWRAMIEPSYHLPFNDTIFGFFGLGGGVNYVTGHEAGFAWQPRLGMNFLVGRSGVLSPALSMTYSTVEALRTEAGVLLAVQSTYGFNIGYTAMW